MADRITLENRSRIMSHIRGKSMVPEMIVRRMVHGMGYRYALHRKDLPGKPDLVFPSRKKIIFVHGCFWHQHRGCKDGHVPKSNLEYWIPKLRRNIQRDQTAIETLTNAGWDILVLWECEMSNHDLLSNKLNQFFKV